MKQYKIAQLLKIFTFLATLMTGLFFLWLVPTEIDTIIMEYPELSYLQTSATMCSGVFFLLCLNALYHFWIICHHIGEGESFCFDNVLHMRNITYIAFSILVFALILFTFLCMNHLVNPPLIVWTIFGGFVISGLCVICYSLTKLLENATLLQEETDLTI